MEMYEIICDDIEKILKDSKLAAPILNLHLPKRAKFERYLQSVLAYELKTLRKFKDTEIEHDYPNNSHNHVDIYSNSTFVELKVLNTNYKKNGIQDAHINITDGVDSVIEDIQKLREAGVESGVVAFVLFPMDDKKMYQHHVDRIKQNLRGNSFKDCFVDQFYIFSAKV